VVVQLEVADTLVALPGSVGRVEAKGFGVRFDPLSAEQQSAVDSLVSSTAGQELEQSLAIQLAEAQGVIEAYEESLALLRGDNLAVFEKLRRASQENHLPASRRGASRGEGGRRPGRGHGPGRWPGARWSGCKTRVV
jgi:hypothetical protein